MSLEISRNALFKWTNCSPACNLRIQNTVSTITVSVFTYLRLSKWLVNICWKLLHRFSSCNKTIYYFIGILFQSIIDDIYSHEYSTVYAVAVLRCVVRRRHPINHREGALIALNYGISLHALFTVGGKSSIVVNLLIKYSFIADEGFFGPFLVQKRYFSLKWKLRLGMLKRIALLKKKKNTSMNLR